MLLEKVHGTAKGGSLFPITSRFFLPLRLDRGEGPRVRCRLYVRSAELNSAVSPNCIRQPCSTLDVPCVSGWLTESNIAQAEMKPGFNAEAQRRKDAEESRFSISFASLLQSPQMLFF
jgi:hypothetical protein